MAPSIGTLGWCVLYFAIGLIGTWLARQYALHRRLLDEPGERRSHKIPTPRGGGIAIVAAMLVALCALIARAPSRIVLLVSLASGLLLVAGIGWVDDHRPLSPWLRLVIHAIAAVLLAMGLYLDGASWTLAGYGFVMALVLVNVWNFMDGIDGLAASQAAIVAIVLSILALDSLAVYLALALMSAICGFLPFNFPKARIFLGDVGSGSLGYGLAALATLSMTGKQPAYGIVLLLPLSAFLIDATLTLLSRMVGGERWWTPHVEHAYQRWVQRSGSHTKVTIGYAVWTLFACLLTLAVLRMDAAFMMVIVLTWLSGGIAICHWLRSRGSMPDG